VHIGIGHPTIVVEVQGALVRVIQKGKTPSDLRDAPLIARKIELAKYDRGQVENLMVTGGSLANGNFRLAHGNGTSQLIRILQPGESLTLPVGGLVLTNDSPPEKKPTEQPGE
jgi:hypothetical protein